MARTLIVVLVGVALAATAISAAEVHPTERDQILEMVSALGSSDEARVEAARQALLAKGDKAVPFLLDALTWSRSEAVRMEAAALLGNLRNDHALTPLFVASQVDPSPGVRMAAQLALERLTADLGERRLDDTRRRDYTKVTREMIIELKKRLKSDPDEQVRAEAADSLGTYGAESELGFLYDRAKRDKAPRVRVAVLTAIRRLTYPLVLARDFRALSLDPARHPHDPIAVLTTQEMIALLLHEEHPDVRVAIVQNLTECVYPIFLLGEQRMGRGAQSVFNDHSWIIEEVTDQFTRDLERTSNVDVKRAEITALIRLLSAYYRVGDVNLQDEIRRRLTTEVRRTYLAGGTTYRGVLVHVHLDRYYRTSPPKNDALAKQVTAVMKDQYLSNADARVRRLAVEAIGLFGDASDSIAIVQGLKKEKNLDVWEAAVTALGPLDKNSSATYLLKLFDWPTAPDRLRAAAARSIGMIYYPVVTRQLAARLEDERSLDVRLAVIEALGYRRDAVAADALLRQLGHSDARVRAAALAALRENPAQSSLAAIEALLRTDPDPAVRAAAAPTLTTLARQQAVPALTRACGDESAGVRRAAVVELGVLKSAQAVDALIAAATDDEDADVRLEAAVSLGAIGDPKAIEPLVRCALMEAERANREAIYEALLAIKQPNTVIVAIWGKLAPLAKENPVVYDELQELLVYLREQSLGHTVPLPG
jgi:HEAT repeat protein